MSCKEHEPDWMDSNVHMHVDGTLSLYVNCKHCGKTGYEDALELVPVWDDDSPAPADDDRTKEAE